MSYSLLSRVDPVRNWVSGAGDSAMTGCMKQRVRVCGNVALGIYTHTKNNSRTELETIEMQSIMSRGICKNKKHMRRDVMLPTISLVKERIHQIRRKGIHPRLRSTRPPFPTSLSLRKQELLDGNYSLYRRTNPVQTHA